ncbi:MAG: hypothetical protein CMK07_02665 [Ponticaulis sp.]|nr:hypothetical protein [Ponticaulis sp.]
MDAQLTSSDAGSFGASSSTGEGGSQAQRLHFSGKIKRKELRTLARKVRTGHIGPTSVYYAGVTGPAIAAGMASLVAATINRLGWPDPIILMVSSLVAAMAGISWYLIFMRWAYRQGYGRGTELETVTEIDVDDLGVYWTRGAMHVRIHWSGIKEIVYQRRMIRLCAVDGDDVFLPRSWFSSRAEMQTVFGHLKSMHDRAIAAG